MGTDFAKANGIDICYETFGNPKDPALLLVMGFTAQLVAWDEAFCETLANRGRYVIRFDNRDCGLSTHLDGVAVDLPAVLAAVAGMGAMPPVPYTLSAFSDDAFGLLDHLGIDQAHIFGASMGGMIVQTMAVEHPERVLSMTSVMSTTGEPDYFQSAPEAMEALMTPPPEEREAYIAFSVERGALFSSPRYYDKPSAGRAGCALLRSGLLPRRRRSAVGRDPGVGGPLGGAAKVLQVPTLVIHGRADTLILPMGGERTAELIPGANLLMFNDMGHDVPKPLWPLIVDAVISHSTHRIGAAGLRSPTGIGAPAEPGGRRAASSVARCSSTQRWKRWPPPSLRPNRNSFLAPVFTACWNPQAGGVVLVAHDVLEEVGLLVGQFPFARRWARGRAGSSGS